MLQIGICTKHRCELVKKPWCAADRRRPSNRRMRGSDVLVCLACVAEAKAKVRIEKARESNRPRNFGRKTA